MRFVILIVTFLLTPSVYAEESSSAIFTSLPPDPGVAGKLTLAGIDSDNDGVRDDVQRWIVMTYPNSQKTRAALIQDTKAMQKILSDANIFAKLYNDFVQDGRAMECLSYIRPNDFDRVLDEQKAIFLDTYLRSKTWLQANSHLSGSSFDLLPNSKSGCNFNPDAMPN